LRLRAQGVMPFLSPNLLRSQILELGRHPVCFPFELHFFQRDRRGKAGRFAYIVIFVAFCDILFLLWYRDAVSPISAVPPETILDSIIISTTRPRTPTRPSRRKVALQNYESPTSAFPKYAPAVLDHCHVDRHAAQPLCGPGQRPCRPPVLGYDLGPPEYIDTGKTLVAQFNQEHPDITVNYRSVPWTNWYQTFIAAIGSGTAPDLSTGAGYQAIQLYDQDAILPIDDVISEWRANGKLDDFLPSTIGILKYKDHYVALPWAIDIRVWYYRKDLFEEAHVQPPTSWQELKAAAQTLTNTAGSSLYRAPL
jgi:Bacterial extracellular solute-binding protein